MLVEGCVGATKLEFSTLACCLFGGLSWSAWFCEDVELTSGNAREDDWVLRLLRFLPGAFLFPFKSVNAEGSYSGRSGLLVNASD